MLFPTPKFDGVVLIGYVFKPRKEQVDRVAQAVMELKAAGVEINISRFYEMP
jgi:hypothetical protein